MDISKTSTDQSVKAEHIATLYRLMPRALPVYPFGGLLLVITLWGDVPRGELLLWMASLLLITLVRTILIRSFRRNSPAPESITPWAYTAVASTVVSGALLGISAIAFLDPAQPLSMLVIAGIIMGATSGGLGTLSPHPPAYWGFVIPSMGTLLVVLFMQGDPGSTIIAIICVLMQGTNILTCLTLYRAMDTALRMSYENESLLRQAEQANAAKTRFLASASHDLRQPLHALGLFFAALANQVRSRQTQALLDRIEEALSSVGNMLTSILDISKLDAGIVKPVIGKVNLSEMFARLEKEFTPIAAENGNQLRIRPTTLYLRSDVNLFERILRNLITNAARYTCDGRILVVARRKNGTIRCEVHDTGPGIAPEQQQTIFEEFYQVDNSERDHQQGMGLGLAIVRRNTALLNHPMQVHSVLGRGACFSVTAPFTPPPPPVSRAIDNGSDGLGFRGATILLVDDDPIVIAAMSALLEQWGCRVLTADSPDSATRVLDRTQSAPRIILVDYRLRDGVTGNQVIETLQKRYAEPIPAVIVTGDTAPERLREATRAGYPLLHKPVDPAKLMAALQQLLGPAKKPSPLGRLA